MEYKIEGKVKIPLDECEDFEEALKNKDFEFFRYLSGNNAKIKVAKRNKYAERSNKKIVDSLFANAKVSESQRGKKNGWTNKKTAINNKYKDNKITRWKRTNLTISRTIN